MRLPPLKSLSYFKTAAELGSFKLAAQQLNVTQAAVSQQIRLLEEHLQCQLFTRQTRQVSLTKEGRLLLPYINAGFKSFNEGVNELVQTTQPHTLSVSVLPSFAHSWLMPKLNEFHRQYPEFILRIDPSEQLTDFNSGQIDVGLRFGAGNYPNVRSEYLANDVMVLAYKPGTFDLNKPLQPQLTNQQYILDICPDAERAWQTLFAKYQLPQNHLNAFMEIDNAALVMQAVIAGQGIAVLRKQLIQYALEQNMIEVLPNFSVECEYNYFLVAPAHHFEREKVRLFLSWLKSVLNDITH